MSRPRSLTFKNYFLTGLTALLPLWLTAYIVWFLVSVVGNILFPLIRPWLGRLLQVPPPEPLMVGVAAAVVCLLIYALGYVIIHVLGHGRVAAVEALVAKIPLVRGIHGVVKRLVDVFFGPKDSFQRVVIVEFPVPGQFMIGFVTNDRPLSCTGQPLLPVLVPTTPNPTSGFLLFLAEDKLRFIDLSVDAAMGLILSVGTMSPDEGTELSVRLPQATKPPVRRLIPDPSRVNTARREHRSSTGSGREKYPGGRMSAQPNSLYATAMDRPRREVNTRKGGKGMSCMRGFMATSFVLLTAVAAAAQTKAPTVTLDVTLPNGETRQLSAPANELASLKAHDESEFGFHPTIRDGEPPQVDVAIFKIGSPNEQLGTVEVKVGEPAIESKTTPMFKIAVPKVTPADQG